jgi:hypothetical protein
MESGDGSLLVTLNDAVAATLESFNKADSGATLSLKLEGGRAEIIGSTSYESANASQRSIRELLTALYHPNLRGSLLTGLVWADEGLDDQHRRIIWPLLMRLASLLGRPDNSTLLLFAGDPILDYGLHCQGNPSLSGRITSGGYEHRRTFASNSGSVRETSRLSQDEAGLVVLFLGAGASVVEGLPTGNQLRDMALARQVGSARVDQGNFELSAREFYQQLLESGDRLRAGEEDAGEDAFVATLTLERVLLEEQSQENRLDCWTVRKFAREHKTIVDALAESQSSGTFASDSLVRLLEMRRRLVIVTVNFDRIIEVKAGDAVRPYVDESELAQLPADLRAYRTNGGPVPLVKLHGDIDRPQSIVVNIEETASGLSAARLNALEGILEVMKEQEVRPWWFVGYSMRDLDLDAHWESAGFADTMVEHWVAPFVDASVEKFIRSRRQPRWDRNSFGFRIENRVVTLTASDFFALLHEQTCKNWLGIGYRGFTAEV